MKRYDPSRADRRPIEEKALGLLFAMTDEEAKRLKGWLSKIAAHGSNRAKMFSALGNTDIAEAPIDPWQPIETAPTDDGVEFLAWKAGLAIPCLVTRGIHGQIIDATSCIEYQSMTHWRHVDTPEDYA